jgi:hypothetical protein
MKNRNIIQSLKNSVLSLRKHVVKKGDITHTYLREVENHGKDGKAVQRTFVAFGNIRAIGLRIS